MVYITVLNWNNSVDTISCINSLFKLCFDDFKIVVCDNFSARESYDEIKKFLVENACLYGKILVELNKEQSEFYSIPEYENGVYLIQTGANLGFAGGNNVGIKFSMNQADFSYAWLLNNDTEVEPDSLTYLVEKAESDPLFGICGSRLIYYYERDFLQGFGGTYNPWLATTRHYMGLSPSSINVDESTVENEIDYVIGASMLLSARLIRSIGLISEEYFLYYEELDLAWRARSAGFKLGVASQSLVFHKEGATTSHDKGTISDYYSIRNRLVITEKFNKRFYVFVYLSLFLVAFNRLRRGHINKFINVLKILAGL